MANKDAEKEQKEAARNAAKEQAERWIRGEDKDTCPPFPSSEEIENLLDDKQLNEAG